MDVRSSSTVWFCNNTLPQLNEADVMHLKSILTLEDICILYFIELSQKKNLYASMHAGYFCCFMFKLGWIGKDCVWNMGVCCNT